MKKKKTEDQKNESQNNGIGEVKEKIDNLLSRYSPDQMFDDFMALKPGERLKTFASFAEYMAPKLARTDIIERVNPENNVHLYLPDNGRN
jgi:hypothetical protein